MNGHFEFELKKDYLYVRISGSYEKNEFLALIDEIKSRCGAEKTYKVLVDARTIQNADLSTTDRYFLGEKIALEFRGNIVISVVWPEEYIDRFGQIVASNRGGRIFVTGHIGSAEDWLEKNPD